MKVIVTGGAGFIGSALVRHIMASTDWRIVNLDKLTYAGNLASVAEAAKSNRYKFVRLDIGDRRNVRALLAAEKPDAVIHLAAESHVDRSIDAPENFVETNIVGTYRLLAAALDYWRTLDEGGRQNFRFHHVSTDEVFGSLPASGHFLEDSPYQPNSPYSASKAASDHLARAWFHTYGLPVLVTNCSNNYGPCQFPEKLIPHMILRALEGKSLPVYGKGENVRDWLYVDDHAHALTTVLTRGRPGETHNIGGNAERRNIDVVQMLCTLLDEALPQSASRPHTGLIRFVQDRPGHDARYAIDTGKMRREFGWNPTESFETGLRKTVAWYLENTDWWQQILSGAYRADRIGLIGNGI